MVGKSRFRASTAGFIRETGGRELIKREVKREEKREAKRQRAGSGVGRGDGGEEKIEKAKSIRDTLIKRRTGIIGRFTGGSARRIRQWR